MRTHLYKLEGKDVPANLRGTEIRIPIPETLDEAKSLTVNGESDVVAKFADGLVIQIQGALRTKSKKESAEALQAFVDGYRYTVRTEGNGARREVKPETKAKRVEQAVANKLFVRMRDDEKFRERMLKFAPEEVAGFEEWLTLNPAQPAQA